MENVVMDTVLTEKEACAIVGLAVVGAAAIGGSFVHGLFRIRKRMRDTKTVRQIKKYQRREM